MKPTTKDLIQRLKELAKEKLPIERNVGAMCYSRMAPPQRKCKCKHCGKRITYSSWDGNSIKDEVKEMAKLGFDTKVEILCDDCFKKTLMELYSQYNPDNFVFTVKFEDDKEIILCPSDRNFLFYFRTDKDEPYHRVLANESFNYELLLHFLKGDSHFLDEFDEDVFIKEYLYVIEYMTGIKAQ